MSEEIFTWWHQKKRFSSYEIRKLKEKALQSYKQIDTVQELSDKEQALSTKKAELALEQFIISNKIPHGK